MELSATNTIDDITSSKIRNIIVRDEVCKLFDTLEKQIKNKQDVNCKCGGFTAQQITKILNLIFEKSDTPVVSLTTVTLGEVNDFIVAKEISRIHDEIKSEPKKSSVDEKFHRPADIGDSDIYQVLELLDRITNRYWVYYGEDEVFYNNDYKSLVSVLEDAEEGKDYDYSYIDEGYYIFGNATLKMIKEKIVPFLFNTDN